MKVKKQLFWLTTMIIFLGLCSLFVASVYFNHTDNHNMAQNTVVEVAQLVVSLYRDDADISEFSALENNIRITIIASDGSVLAESNPLDFDLDTNHLSRPEIRAAATGNPEVHIRYSETLGTNFIYYALQMNTLEGYIFVRAAIPVASVNAYLVQSLPLFMGILVVVALLCFFVNRTLINRITKPFDSIINENRINAKRREEFFANASHELKTPLTAIKGFTELTAINNQDENIRKYINSITRETERMSTLIGDMLKLSELESMPEITPVQVSLASTVAEVQDTVSTAIKEKNINFTATGDATIMAEQGHIYELVKNLIENAVRYNTDGGKVSVNIKTERKNVRLTVADTGVGIPDSEQGRIFERFYRIEKSRSQQSGGTGLGLAIVKHICALYGWKLSVKSEVGVGTEVIVEMCL